MKETGFKYREWIANNKFIIGLDGPTDIVVEKTTLNETNKANKK